jgi:hypothetical protein
VDFYELDSALPSSHLIDDVRAFHTGAPGGWAYVQNRWEHEGLVFNGGLRAEYFSAGDASVPLGNTPGTTTPATRHAPGGITTWSPRLGLAPDLGARRDVVHLRAHPPSRRDVNTWAKVGS